MLYREMVMGRMMMVSRNVALKTHGMTGCEKVPVLFLFWFSIFVPVVNDDQWAIHGGIHLNLFCLQNFDRPKNSRRHRLPLVVLFL